MQPYQCLINKKSQGNNLANIQTKAMIIQAVNFQAIFRQKRSPINRNCQIKNLSNLIRHHRKLKQPINLKAIILSYHLL